MSDTTHGNDDVSRKGKREDAPCCGTRCCCAGSALFLAAFAVLAAAVVRMAGSPLPTVPIQAFFRPGLAFAARLHVLTEDALQRRLLAVVINRFQGLLSEAPSALRRGSGPLTGRRFASMSSLRLLDAYFLGAVGPKERPEGVMIFPVGRYSRFVQSLYDVTGILRRGGEVSLGDDCRLVVTGDGTDRPLARTMYRGHFLVGRNDELMRFAVHSIRTALAAPHDLSRPAVPMLPGCDHPFPRRDWPSAASRNGRKQPFMSFLAAAPSLGPFRLLDIPADLLAGIESVSGTVTITGKDELTVSTAFRFHTGGSGKPALSTGDLVRLAASVRKLFGLERGTPGPTGGTAATTCPTTAASRGPVHPRHAGEPFPLRMMAHSDRRKATTVKERAEPIRRIRLRISGLSRLLDVYEGRNANRSR